MFDTGPLLVNDHPVPMVDTGPVPVPDGPVPVVDDPVPVLDRRPVHPSQRHPCLDPVGCSLSQ